MQFMKYIICSPRDRDGAGHLHGRVLVSDAAWLLASNLPFASNFFFPPQLLLSKVRMLV